MSGVELQPRCRKARCNYQDADDVATWMIGYIVNAIGISITNMSFAILECCSRYRPWQKDNVDMGEGDAMPRFIVRFFWSCAHRTFDPLLIFSFPVGSSI